MALMNTGTDGGRMYDDLVVSLDQIADSTFFAEHDPDFASGHRSQFVFATPSMIGSYRTINAAGPDPASYLQFAKADIAENSMRGPINAMGNAKRAVHLSVDAFLKLFFLDNLMTPTSNFPLKLRLLADIGAFPTRLISSLNDKRNLVEHEYLEPTAEEALTSIEIAEMFVVLAYRFFQGATVGVYTAYCDDRRCVEWRLDVAHRRLILTAVDATLKIRSTRGPIYYNVAGSRRRQALREIALDDTHRTEWLPIVDLFVYCTQRRAFRLGGEGLDDRAGIPNYWEVNISHGEAVTIDGGAFGGDGSDAESL
jgi:hypothetical protein